MEDLTEKIFFNDLIMRNILSNLSFKERKDIELASRRMYYLSITTPCEFPYSSSLKIQEVWKHNQKKYKITMLDCHDNPFRPNSEFAWHSSYVNEPEELVSIFMKFGINIREVVFKSVVNTSFVKLLNILPNLSAIVTRGFTTSAIRYLSTRSNKLVKRIKSITFKEVDSFLDPRALVPFEALDEIRYEFLTYDIEHILTQLQYKKHIRSIYLDWKGPVDFSRLSPYCKEISFKMHHLNIDSVRDIDQFASVDISLYKKNSIFNEELFTVLNVHNLKSVTLSYFYMSDQIIEMLQPKHVSKMTELELYHVFCHETLYKTLPLLSICPPTLKRLGLHSVFIENQDLNFILKNCKHLEEVAFWPSEIDKSKKEYHTTCSKMFEEFYIKAMKDLPLLKSFRLFFFIDPEFILTMYKSKRVMEELLFQVYDIDITDILEKFSNMYSEVKRYREEYETSKKTEGIVLEDPESLSYIYTIAMRYSKNNNFVPTELSLPKMVAEWPYPPSS